MVPHSSRRLLRLTLLAVAAVAAFGCNTKKPNGIAGQAATPVSPSGYVVSITSSRSTLPATTEESEPVAALITVQALKYPEWTPVPDLTKVNLTTTLGGFDTEGGGQQLQLELFNGTATANLFPGSTPGTARVRAEVLGAVAVVNILIKDTTGGGGGTEVPVASTVTLSANPATVSDEVAGPTMVTLTAVVRDQTGDPIKNASVNFIANVGTLASGGTEKATNSDGEAFDVLTLTQAELLAAGSTIATSAVLGVEGGTKTATFNIAISHGPAPPVASSLTLSTNKSSVDDDGGGDSITASATVRDQYGAVLPGVSVQLESALGSPTPQFVNSNGSGIASATFNLTAGEISSHPTNAFQIMATIGTSGGALTKSTTINIIRGPEPPVPTSVTLSADKSTVTDDGGGDSIVFTATVRDQNGAVLGGVDTDFTTELGSLSAATDTSDGGGHATSTLTLTGPQVASFPSDSFKVTATIGTAGGTAMAQSTITILRTPTPLVAEFSHDGPACLTGHQVVNFTDLSTGGPDTWLWDLDGDGFTDDANLANPSFNYGAFSTPQDITVTLVVKRGGTTTQVQHSLHIDVDGAGGCPP